MAIIPLEILLQIVEEVDRCFDRHERWETLSNMRLANRHLHTIVTPVLVREIDIYSGRERSIRQMLGLAKSGLTKHIVRVNISMLAVVPERLLRGEFEEMFVVDHIGKAPFKYHPGDIVHYSNVDSTVVAAEAHLLGQPKVNRAFLAFFGGLAAPNARFKELWIDSRYRLLDHAETSSIRNFAFNLILWQNLVCSGVTVDTMHVSVNHLYPLRADDISEPISVKNFHLDIEKASMFRFRPSPGITSPLIDHTNWMYELFDPAYNLERFELSFEGRFESMLSFVFEKWPEAPKRLKKLTISKTLTAIEVLLSVVNDYKGLEYLKLEDVVLNEDDDNWLRTWQFVFETASQAISTNSMIDFDFVNLSYHGNTIQRRDNPLYTSQQPEDQDLAKSLPPLSPIRLDRISEDMEAWFWLVGQLNSKRVAMGLPKLHKETVSIGYQRVLEW